MSSFTALSWQGLVRSFEAKRRRTYDQASEQRGVQNEPEQLERIAAYARAGYFNMGYTFEMFPLVGDLPPH
ncbi:hypothetical protein [Paraburkholderia sp. J12]|uniref:hypothetical protein n=1 Tax=Paraburkholderia sp. J12 TaxID=2805432 RepID=UPI002ABE02B9|nr:hypothetical protein [Paraburkholderia sp. J12]